jgi:DNA-binding MarR family transcriptional regulator
LEHTTYELITLIKRLAALLHQNIDAKLKPFGLARTQYSMMYHLHTHPDASTSELAERMMIEPATLSGIVDTLQAKGLVKRVDHASDKRRKDIRLTIKGIGVFGTISNPGPTIELIMLEGISYADCATIKSAGRQMVENLQNELKRQEGGKDVTKA